MMLTESPSTSAADPMGPTVAIIGVVALTIINAALGAGAGLAFGLSALTLIVAASSFAQNSAPCDRLVEGVVVDHRRRLSSKQSGGLREMFYDIIEFSDGGEHYRFTSRSGSRQRSPVGSAVSVSFIPSARPKALIATDDEPWNPAFIAIPGSILIAALMVLAGWFSIVPVAAAVVTVIRFKEDVPLYAASNAEQLSASDVV